MGKFARMHTCRCGLKFRGRKELSAHIRKDHNEGGIARVSRKYTLGERVKPAPKQKSPLT